MDRPDALPTPWTTRWPPKWPPPVAAASTSAWNRAPKAVLRRVRKGTDCESIRLGIESAKKAGIRVKTGWVFGLPGTIDEQYESVAFMRELRIRTRSRSTS